MGFGWNVETNTVKAIEKIWKNYLRVNILKILKYIYTHIMYLEIYIYISKGFTISKERM